MALEQLLTLVRMHCPAQNRIPSSVSFLKKIFNDMGAPKEIHSFCPDCKSSVSYSAPKCLSCDKSLKGCNIPFFVTVDIDQLNSIFNKPGNWDDIQTYRYKDREPGVIKDIYDGVRYRMNTELTDPNNISFLFNTDGVPVLKSSPSSLWPVFLSINELSSTKRFRRGNQVVAGIWFSSQKPLMQTYLRPIVDNLLKLEKEGFNYRAKQVTCKCFTLAVSCDLPAKCLVYCTKQFNGFYGCHKCEIEGLSVAKGKGNVRVFTHKDSISAVKRTQETYLTNAKTASETGSACKGIKGRSHLADLSLDIVDGDAVDYMHKVCQGDVKQLLGLWFQKGNKSPYVISNELKELDDRIKGVKLTTEFERRPRSLEYRSHFKASELRAFLLFYGPIVLNGILPQPWYDHFLCLSEAIHLLLRDRITDGDLKYAQALLNYFSEYFEKLYGQENCSANFHRHQHVCDTVSNLGPLWAVSCFHFEDMNGCILKNIHGSANIMSQVIASISIVQGMSQLKTELLDKSPCKHTLFTSLMSKYGCSSSNTTELSTDVLAVGTTHTRILSKKEHIALWKHLNYACSVTDLKLFSRLKFS